MEQVPAIIGDVVALALGACVGSFAVTVAYRLPRDISIAAPRSFCESCERPIPWWANIPIFAYLASRGRCLMCGAPIRARHLGGELALALAALYLYANFAPGGAIARFIFITALLISSLIDYDWRLIPNLITFPGVLVGFVLAALFMPEVGWKSSLIGIAAGGGVLFVTGYLYQLVRGQEGVGLGDVFLLAMVGAFIGWQGVLFTLFFGALLGSLGGLAVGLFGTPTQAPEPPPGMREASAAPAPAGAAAAVSPADSLASVSIDAQAPDSAAAENEEHALLATAVPFGPFLSLAAGFYALFQPQLASWYLSR
ncbi:MAG TPA: prepilin peptidase [Candidatus Binataceae bacterium]|nr:prepilin peptidase [Candidatus Binataceae bacterium]